jgi:serine protease AprX
VRFTGADGTIYQADSVVVRGADGVSILNPSGILLSGADGVRFTGADGVEAVTADGMRFTGADTVRFTGADQVTGFNADGVAFNLISPADATLTGPDGARFTGADIVLTDLDGVRFTSADNIEQIGAGSDFQEDTNGLQSVDPELALLINRSTDDSSINAVIVFHRYPTERDLSQLTQVGITGGTLFRVLPMIYVSATRQQLVALSSLANVRSIYGNRTLKFNSDPYFKPTQVARVATDTDLQTHNSGFPVTGKNITVAVLDTGVNSLHSDLSGKVIQNVKLVDTQSVSLGFTNPAPVENVPNTDLINGHGTFVSGIIAASGASSAGKYNGVAPGANILGLSAGDQNLLHVLSGFDYILQKGAGYNVRVVNCSFSTEALFDYNDPVNVATKLLTGNGISVVFSAGNTGPANATLNPYAVAPWVVSVGATDEKSVLASFSSRGVFGSPLFSPSVVAPGVNIVSLRAPGTQIGTVGVAGSDIPRLTPAELPFYTTASGTSFSAPQVAGAIALMLEANPNLSPAEIKEILQRSATPLPKYYSHEVGAGMLNTYAAVLEAAFPARKTGAFRAMLQNDGVVFMTDTTQISDGEAGQGSPSSKPGLLPADTVQSSFYVAWNMASQNNLGLKIYDASGNLLGSSDRSNSIGLFGKSEKVTVNLPPPNDLRAEVSYTSGIGTPQSFLVGSEATRAKYMVLGDLANTPAQTQALVYEGLRKALVNTAGKKFYPNSAVTRADLAALLVRTGKVPQFVANDHLYSDVLDLAGRNAVESVQSNPAGSLIFDAVPGGLFRPDESATRLVAAVALVKAAGLDSLAAASTLPINVTDAGTIPLQYRGYAAVALQKGWLSLSNNKFNPNNSITRLELTVGLVGLSR